MKIYLQDQNLWQGVPFVLHVEDAAKLPTALYVEGKNISGMNQFLIPVKVVSQFHGISEMTLQFPGTYVAFTKPPSAQYEFQIKERSNLGLMGELGLLGGLSLLVAGGILIWIIKIKKLKNR